jgi:fatty acid desaturase
MAISNHKWYRSPVPTNELRLLHARSDWQASFRVLGHLSALLLTGSAFCYFSKHSYWVVSLIVLLIHGTIFSFLGYAGACHEFSHYTVFRKKSVNEFFLQLFSFFVWTNHAYFSRTHRIHHLHTLQHDVDSEVPTTKCIAVLQLAVTSSFDFRRLIRTVRIQGLNATGVFPGVVAEKLFPASDVRARRAVRKAARIILLGHFFLALFFLVTGFWQGLLLINVAAFIGNGLPNLLASAQHCGLREDAMDFRENSRTILLNPVIAFFYWNMNYHVEHHMYPGVPCYRLPQLRKLIEADLRPAAMGLRGVFQAFHNDHHFRNAEACYPDAS